MDQNNKLETSYIRLIGTGLCSLLITLFLMGPLLIGFLILLLAYIPILCALPVLWMGWKSVEAFGHWLKDILLGLKALR